MAYISTEALVGGALLLVLALGYHYIPKAGAEGKKKAKKKNKKVNGLTGTSEPTEPEPVVGKRGKKRKPASQGTPSVNGRTVSGGAERGDADTGVAGPTSNGAPSFAAVAASSSSKAPAKPKTLAEKIAPKARKTKVDDMLDPDDLPPTHARVMKIVPSASAPPPAASAASESGGSSAPTLVPPADSKVGKFSDDYESDSDDDVEEDDGWNVVQSKPKKPVSLSLSGASSSPFSAGPSVPGGAAPLPVSTKTQRKNAKKAETKKAAKAAEEADRQKRLAMHKRDLEKEKINEIYASGKKNKAMGKGAGTAGATIENGKLVWD